MTMMVTVSDDVNTIGSLYWKDLKVYLSVMFYINKTRHDVTLSL